jgi:GNAT superfamily N-acetyltransferase
MMAVEDNAVGAPSRTTVLKDGSALVLQVAQAGDTERALAFAQEFCGAATKAAIRQSLEIDPSESATAASPSHCTVLAEIIYGKEGAAIQARPVVGIAHYRRVGRDSAKLTIEVGKPWRGLGVGKALLRELSGRAAADGVGRFHATFAQTNAPMLALLNKCGLEVRLLHGGAGNWEILLNKRFQSHQGATL